MDKSTVSGFFEAYLFGGELTDYGADPWQPLIALVLLIFVFWGLYLGAVIVPSREYGIWRVLTEDSGIEILGKGERKHIGRDSVGIWAVLYTLYFSVLSAFQFGWGDLSVSSWIVRLQAREYQLKPSGWVRRLSGLQSFISIYLVIIWAITYFGLPFG